MIAQDSDQGLSKQNNRGAFLIVMLVFYVLLCLARFISILSPSTFPGIYAGGPSFSYAFNIFLFVLGAVGVAGIVLWRRWGIYTLALGTILGVVFDSIY